MLRVATKQKYLGMLRSPREFMHSVDFVDDGWVLEIAQACALRSPRSLCGSRVSS